MEIKQLLFWDHIMLYYTKNNGKLLIKIPEYLQWSHFLLLIIAKF